MGLASAIPDLARVHRNSKTVTKVDGRPRRVPEIGPWFRCRLDFDTQAPETRDPAHVTYRKRPNFLCGKRAKDRSLIRLEGSDRLEIDSKQFGTGFYSFDGDPEVIRKRKTIFGYMGTIVKIEEDRPSDRVPLFVTFEAVTDMAASLQLV